MYDPTTQKAINHTILPVEPRGDTLVLTPTGDLAGFSRAEFASEFTRVKSLLGGHDVSAEAAAGASKTTRTYDNLIVDFNGAAYFGSEMIGHLVDLRKAMPEGGQMALTGLSKDMHAGLKVMKLDEMWDEYDDRERAVRAIASEPVGERLARGRRRYLPHLIVLAVAAVVLLLLLTPLSYYIFGDPSERDYERMGEFYADWKDLGNEVDTGTDYSPRADRLHSKLDRFSESRRNNMYKLSAAQKRMLQAAQTLRGGSYSEINSASRNAFLKNMAIARFLLAQNQGIEVEPLPDMPELTEGERLAAMNFVTDERRAEIEEGAYREDEPEPTAAAERAVALQKANAGRDGYLPPEAVREAVREAAERAELSEDDDRAAPAVPTPAVAMPVDDVDDAAAADERARREQEYNRLTRQIAELQASIGRLGDPEAAPAEPAAEPAAEPVPVAADPVTRTEADEEQALRADYRRLQEQLAELERRLKAVRGADTQVPPDAADAGEPNDPQPIVREIPAED